VASAHILESIAESASTGRWVAVPRT
jgi:hypothetical protein